MYKTEDKNEQKSKKQAKRSKDTWKELDLELFDWDYDFVEHNIYGDIFISATKIA